MVSQSLTKSLVLAAVLASTGVAAAAAGGVEDTRQLRNGAGQRRRLQDTLDLAGYKASIDAEDVARVDLDVKSFQHYLEEKSHDGFKKAKDVYEYGGHSKSIARVDLKEPLYKDLPEGANATGKGVNGKLVFMQTFRSATKGTQQSIEFRYLHGGCYVGGLHRPDNANATNPGDQTWDSCLEPSGTITISGLDMGLEYNYTIARDNYNGRTLKGFSSNAETFMKPDPDSNDFFEDFQKFYDYYGRADYADEFIKAALNGYKTNFPSGNGIADFSQIAKDYHSREEAIKYGSVFLAVQMMIIREMEKSVHICSELCVDAQELSCQKNMFETLDNAVALYVGTLEGDTPGAGNGKFLYDMADHRAAKFRTAGSDATESSGTSKVNHDIIREFGEMRQHLADLDCVESRRKKMHIVRHMTIPLIQATIEYAHMQREGTASMRSITEGATWAASILPMVAYCDADDAETVYKNMQLKNVTVDFSAVKNALEKNYRCLGITCADVGGLWVESSSSYRSDAQPCEDSSTLTDSTSSGVATSDTGTPMDSDKEKEKDSSSGSSSSSSGSSSSSSGHDQAPDRDSDNEKKDEEFGSSTLVGNAVKTVDVEEAGDANIGLAVGLTIVFFLACVVIAVYVKSKANKKKDQPGMVIFKTQERAIV